MPAKTATALPTLPAIDRGLFDALKEDIRRRGIICPLIIDAKTRQCIDGRVRLMIAEQLGIRNVPKIFVGNLDRSEGEDLRLVLNGLRRQLSRDQLATMIEWSLRKDPGVSDREHARRTGADHKTIGKSRSKLERIGEIPHSPTRKTKGGKTYHSTRKPMVFAHHAAAANEATKALDKLGEKAPEGMSSLRKLRRMAIQEERETELKKSGPSVPKHFDLRCCRFQDLICKSGIADLMILDPPWHTMKDQRLDFAKTVYRILKPGGFALVYTGHQGLLDFGDLLRSAGLTYRWLISCVNDDNSASIRTNGSVYTESRIVSVYQKGGQFKTPSIFRDVLRTRGKDKTYHDWQQSLEESVAFIQSFTRPGQMTVDLTFGTGTVAEAVARVGSGRRFLGCEVRPELVELGKRRVATALEE